MVFYIHMQTYVIPVDRTYPQILFRIVSLRFVFGRRFQILSRAQRKTKKEQKSCSRTISLFNWRWRSRSVIKINVCTKRRKSLRKEEECIICRRKICIKYTKKFNRISIGPFFPARLCEFSLLIMVANLLREKHRLPIRSSYKLQIFPTYFSSNC